MRNKIIMVVLSVALGVSLVLVGCAKPTPGPEPVDLVFSAGSVGGGWYVQSAGMGELVKKYAPEITITVVPGGGVLNPTRVNAGDADLAWAVIPFTMKAVKGEDPYDSPHTNVRALGGYFSALQEHFLAAKGLDFSTIDDMTSFIHDGGAVKLASSQVGSTDEAILRMILAFYDLSYEDIEAAGGKVFFGGYADQVTMYRDRHVDVTVANLAQPAAATTEAAMARESVILAASPELLEHLAQYGLILGVIPGGIYKGIDEDVPATVSGCEIVISKDVSEEVAYKIIKILCENVDVLPQIHSSLALFEPEEAWEVHGAPLHPGVEKYYKEMGWMP